MLLPQSLVQCMCSYADKAAAQNAYPQGEFAAPGPPQKGNESLACVRPRLKHAANCTRPRRYGQSLGEPRQVRLNMQPVLPKALRTGALAELVRQLPAGSGPQERALDQHCTPDLLLSYLSNSPASAAHVKQCMRI